MRNIASITWATAATLAFLGASGCSKSDSDSKPTASIGATSGERRSLDASPFNVDGRPGASGRPQVASYPVVKIDTTMGPILVELHPDWAWKTVDNFLSYVERKHYDGTIFHTCVRDRAIVGGGFTQDLHERTETLRTPIMNEARECSLKNVKNTRGALAMIRRPDSAHSAQSQFFISLADNPNLDYKGPSDAEYGYCVFGRIKEGMDVVEAIAQVPVKDQTRAQDQFTQLPQKTILINSIRLVEPEPSLRTARR